MNSEESLACARRGGGVGAARHPCRRRLLRALIAAGPRGAVTSGPPPSDGPLGATQDTWSHSPILGLLHFGKSRSARNHFTVVLGTKGSVTPAGHLAPLSAS